MLHELEKAYFEEIILIRNFQFYSRNFAVFLPYYIIKREDLTICVHNADQTLKVTKSALFKTYFLFRVNISINLGDAKRALKRAGIQSRARKKACDPYFCATVAEKENESTLTD